MATVAEKLPTAEEYGATPDSGCPPELVRGRVIDVPPPGFRHGKVCLNIGLLIANWVKALDLGHVLGNDSGVIPGRDPDTVRGADISFFSYKRVPRRPVPTGYPEVAPEVVFGVVSPINRWNQITTKVAEYLNAGVLVVSVVDPEHDSVEVYRADEPMKRLGPDDEWAATEVFGEFRVPVREFFE